MTIQVSAFLTDLGIQLGDPSNTLWPRTQLLSFLKRAYRLTAPWFFTPIEDLTTYTGLNAVTVNTKEVPVPAAFLATPSTTEVAANGEVTGLKVRLSGTTTVVEPISPVFFPVSVAEIDPLSIATPKIRFLSPYNNIFELQVFGWKPLSIPSADDTSPLDGSDHRGFLEWLTLQCEVFSMANKETNTNDDKRGYGRRHLLDQSDADKMRWRYRMSKPNYTQFKQIAR
jgi:hypothetical protein